MDTIGEQNIKF